MAAQTSINPSAAVLWASAFVIAALIIVQAGRLPGNPAYADATISRGDYTLVTSDSGRGGGTPYKLLYVIDSRAQTLLVYEIEDARRNLVMLRDGAQLDNVFRIARQ